MSGALVLATTYLLHVLAVYDGDTLTAQVLLPEPLDAVSIRIRGIDTPEMPASSYRETGRLGRAGCKAEAEAAIAARDLVDKLVRAAGGAVRVGNLAWDKYGGRILADVQAGDVFIAEALLQAGLAVRYDGGTKAANWCEASP